MKRIFKQLFVVLCLPAAGGRCESSFDHRGTLGCYWSSSLDTSGTVWARNLSFISGSASAADNDRYYGRSVRPVLRK